MPARSFESDGSKTVVAPNGARVHRDHLAHNEVLLPEFYEVCPGTWCFVGNGLSNQTFVDAPEGIIAFDTGESVQEMASALRELRLRTSKPIGAVVYTHFHYVDGTQAVVDEGNFVSPLRVLGHPGISSNKSRTAGEIAPAYGRGLVEQFGIVMPQDGPDALINVGLGLSYRNPAHAPAKPGHLPVTEALPSDGEVMIAGARVTVKHSPSDSDDSVNFFFPDSGICVHNSVWPALFNVFAIRGEEYRDPRVLIAGIENIIDWGPNYLIGTHGPPLAGRDDIRQKAERYRDSIQFLWDQAVRGLNKGWTIDEIASRIMLPPNFDSDYLTSERYGIAEHHLRQICTGLRGWFDGEESRLFPEEPASRFKKLIDGFGGRDEVSRQAKEAFDNNDVRWGVELATWLARSPDADTEDKQLLAAGLRLIAERTPAANIRNWTITRARHLDGQTPMDRFNRHVFSSRSMARASVSELVHTLRVLIDPTAASGVAGHIRFSVDGDCAGLRIRNCVAIPTSGDGADVEVALTRSAFESVLAGKSLWSEVDVAVNGAVELVDVIRCCFEHDGLSG